MERFVGFERRLEECGSEWSMARCIEATETRDEELELLGGTIRVLHLDREAYEEAVERTRQILAEGDFRRLRRRAPLRRRIVLGSRGVNIQPAKGGDFSTGLDNPKRMRHPEYRSGYRAAFRRWRRGEMGMTIELVDVSASPFTRPAPGGARGR